MGHPERDSWGEVTIYKPGWLTPSIVLADEITARGAEFVHSDDGGRVSIRTGPDWGSVYLRAADEDQTPTVGLHAGVENLDARGATLARRSSWSATTTTTP